MNHNYLISSFRFSLASPEQIIQWSTRKLGSNIFHGEITEPLTINIKTETPYINGLFCERIFGSLQSGCCVCGRLNWNSTKSNNSIHELVCYNCNMEVTDSNVRRYRMGYVRLQVPIFSNLYKSFNILSLLLDLKEEIIQDCLYYKTLLTIPRIKNKHYQELINLEKHFTIYTTSELVFITSIWKNYLETYNILNELIKTRNNYYQKTLSMYKKIQILKKLQLLRLFFLNNINPSWTFLTVLPVLPADLRPYKKLENNNYIVEPINELYKLILIKNNRLRRWIKLRKNIPIFFELLDKKQLQLIIDLLFETKSNKTFKHLTINASILSKLQGKAGLFRQHILGKRIDYSGRSVIIPSPTLTIKEIGVPIEIGLTLYKPKLLQVLKTQLCLSYLYSLLYTQYKTITLKYLLTKICHNEFVLINRAPTLHRMNIQAFKPRFIEGESIALYPLSCASFNADFDGDQVGIFGNLTKSSLLEIKQLMASDKNIYSPAYRTKLLTKPTQSINLGIYTLNQFRLSVENPLVVSNVIEILYLNENKLIALNAPVWVKGKIYKSPFSKIQYTLTSCGRLLTTYSFK